jgi:hypothetical protein
MRVMGWRRGGTAVVMAGIAACQGGAPVPESPTLPAVVTASAAAPPPVASVAVPTEARKIEIAGLRLADPVPGQRPGGAHPKGTVIALAYGVGGKDAVGLVELDVATGAESKRSKVTVEGRARLVREGDAIHVAAASSSGAFVWVTVDLSLDEQHRVAPTKAPASVDERSLVGFAVLDGRAAIVGSARGAVVELIDDKGKTLAKHDCKASVGMLADTRIERAGGVALIDGLLVDQSPLACGFRIDGTGAPLRKKHARADSFFAHDGAFYANAAGEIHRLDAALAATDPAVPDPRPCSDPRAACAKSCAAGVGGEATMQSLMMADVLVLRTMGCCGGPPGGLFFCDPSAQKKPDHH